MSEPPYLPPPDEYPQSYQDQYAQTYQAPSTGMATTSLALGITSIPTTCVCIGPLLGLAAVILGVIAVGRAGGQPALYGGRGRAVGGIITGGLSLVLTIVAVSCWGYFAGEGMHVARTAVNTENIGKALQAYHAIYSEYPPDLATLADTDMIAENPVPGAGGDPTSGVYYVVGIEPSDPSHWIVAYAHTSIMGVKLVGVVYTAGDSDMLEQTEFARALASFKQEYEAGRGQPPTVLEPPAAREPLTIPGPDDAP